MSKVLLILDVENDQMNHLTDQLPEKIKKYLDNNHYDSVISAGKGEVVNVLKPYVMQSFKRSGLNAVNKDLRGYLLGNNVTEIDVCGVNTESTILSTMFSLYDAGYKVHGVRELCASKGSCLDSVRAFGIMRLSFND